MTVEIQCQAIILLQSITTGANITINQSKFLASTCNSLKNYAGKIIGHTWCNWFWFCVSAVEKLA